MNCNNKFTLSHDPKEPAKEEKQQEWTVVISKKKCTLPEFSDKMSKTKMQKEPGRKLTHFRNSAVLGSNIPWANWSSFDTMVDYSLTKGG